MTKRVATKIMRACANLYSPRALELLHLTPRRERNDVDYHIVYNYDAFKYSYHLLAILVAAHNVLHREVFLD